MRVDARLSAFLADTDRQERLRVEGQRWVAAFTAHPPIARLSSALAQMSDNPPENVMDFAELLRPWTQSFGWVQDVVDSWLSQLASDDFARLPLIMQASPVFLGLALAVRGQANASLSLVNSMTLPKARSHNLVFDHGYSMVVLVGGGAVTAERFVQQRDGCGGSHMVKSQAAPLPLYVPIALDCGQEQLRIISAEGDAVLLRFSCSKRCYGTRVFEYDTQSGRTLRTGVGDSAVSRKLALLQFVTMQNDVNVIEDALVQLVHDDDALLRWEAMRPLVCRYPDVAYPILSAMAKNDPDCQIREVAGRVMTMLSAENAACGA